MSDTSASDFTKQFNELNRLSGPNSVRNWLLSPEMNYQSMDKWWGDLGKRTVAHEGIDLGFYRRKDDAIHSVGRDTKIPALFDGRLIHRFPDFLGESIVFKTERRDKDSGEIFCFIYGHVSPVNQDITEVTKGQGIARVAAIDRKTIHSHLHVTVGWATERNLSRLNNWSDIVQPEVIRLVDPGSLITDMAVVDRPTLFTPG